MKQTEDVPVWMKAKGDKKKAKEVQEEPEIEEDMENLISMMNNNNSSKQVLKSHNPPSYQFQYIWPMEDDQEAE